RRWPVLRTRWQLPHQHRVPKGPAMDLLSALPLLLSRWLSRLVCPLDRRTAPRLLQLLVGLLFARGRRTVTSWFRPAGITDEFRPAYRAVHAAGQRTDVMAFVVWAT